MEQKKILVVDDHDNIRMMISFILQEEGYAVTELDNGKQVFDKVKLMHPDVILLDVMLGDSDGRDICKKLKDSFDTEIIPIIIVSASHGRHTMHEKNCRADNYLKKPFDIIDLVSQVKRYAA